jgi:hypothetical protein
MRIDSLLGGGVSAGDNRRRNRRVGRRRRFAAGSRYLDKAKARMGANSDGHTRARNPTLNVQWCSVIRRALGTEWFKGTRPDVAANAAGCRR